MTKETKRGSSGGTARAEKLTTEQRKAIASAAATARWDKIRKAKQEASNPVAVEASPEPIPAAPVTPEPTTILQTFQAKRTAPKKRKGGIPERKTPKVYGQALAAANRDYVESTEELTYHEEKIAILKARIPRLVETIRSLGGTINPSAPPQPHQYRSQPQESYTPPNPDIPLKPVPMAHGGAIGGVVADQEELPEDYFLRDSVIGGKFV